MKAKTVIENAKTSKDIENVKIMELNKLCIVAAGFVEIILNLIVMKEEFNQRKLLNVLNLLKKNALKYKMKWRTEKRRDKGFNACHGSNRHQLN